MIVFLKLKVFTKFPHEQLSLDVKLLPPPCGNPLPPKNLLQWGIESIN
jgi:hypothetical protein